MKRNKFISLVGGLPLLLLSGCGGIGEKAASPSVIYGAAAMLSLVLLVVYCAFSRKRENWYVLLFAAVVVVNMGYFTLSVSSNLEEALLANRIAYLGSVFLPMTMLMIILRITDIACPKWVPRLLLVLGLGVFMVAASPGYLDIYYAQVSFQRLDGVSSLVKVYGPWHCLYLVYLLGYFAVMVAELVYAIVKNKIHSVAQGLMLTLAVFCNVCIWLAEQVVEIDFEMLSLSYVITELFLLGLKLVAWENEKAIQTPRCQSPEAEVPVEAVSVPPAEEEPVRTPEEAEQCSRFREGMEGLTRTEKLIFDAYISGKSTKEIMAELNIKENTLKFHNKNLYGKLGVCSRKQLVEIYRQLN